jgi:hypothetical protein
MRRCQQPESAPKKNAGWRGPRGSGGLALEVESNAAKPRERGADVMR